MSDENIVIDKLRLYVNDAAPALIKFHEDLSAKHGWRDGVADDIRKHMADAEAVLAAWDAMLRQAQAPGAAGEKTP